MGRGEVRKLKSEKVRKRKNFIVPAKERGNEGKKGNHKVPF